MQCIILAGGLGTRLKNRTYSRPKCLININNKPFAQYQLKKLSKQGVNNIVYSIGYLGDMIRSYIENNDNYGMQIKFADEGDNLRGTGGAIRYCYDLGLLENKFLILYGDSYLPIDFTDIWSVFSKNNYKALMTVQKNYNQYDKSNVEYADNKVILYDKNNIDNIKLTYIDYGLLILNKDIVSELFPENIYIDLSKILNVLSIRGDLAGYEVSERFYEIGSEQGIKDFSEYLRKLENINR